MTYELWGNAILGLILGTWVTWLLYHYLYYIKGFTSRDFHDWFDFWYGLTLALEYTAMATWSWAGGEYFWGGIWAINALMWFRDFWNNPRRKKKRKQLIDWASGVVRDVGGKLKVINGPIPEH